MKVVRFQRGGLAIIRSSEPESPGIRESAPPCYERGKTDAPQKFPALIIYPQKGWGMNFSIIPPQNQWKIIHMVLYPAL